MAIDLSAKEEIKRNADIVDLIGQYVRLKKAGRNHVGLCPFHAEKAPSFTVNHERQTFHCFGCKKGGDIFTFWMEYHNLTFPEAIKDLADRYQVTLSTSFSPTEDKKRMEKREALFKINKKALDFFRYMLAHVQKGKPARAYLNDRTLGKNIISTYQLGYAPDDWSALSEVFRREGINLENAAEAGLVVRKKNGGYYDRFRGRIIFPIFDMQQRVVGFGGRVIDESMPKYLNTPETPIFHKGEIFYGLNDSYPSLRQSGRAILVEGYMDWLAVKKHGIKEVVATLGTALTAKHVRRLKGYSKKAILVMDADEAGKSATLRSMPIFMNEGLDAFAVMLPANRDPDSYLNAHGPDNFRTLLDEAVPIFDFFLEQRLSRDISSVEGKVRVLKDVLPAVLELNNGIQRSLYLSRLSEKTGIKEQVIRSELSGIQKKSNERNAVNTIKKNYIESGEKNISDLQLLNLLIYHPDTISRLNEDDCSILISDPTVLEIVDTVYDTYGKGGKWSVEGLLERLKSESARERLREILHRPFTMYSEQDVEQAVVDFRQKAYQKKMLASLKEARGNAETQNHLLKLKSQGPIAP